MAEPDNGSSPLAEALATVGDRWTLLVVEALLGGPQRFNDLLGQIPGIAPNILSERLKRLEPEGRLNARHADPAEAPGTRRRQVPAHVVVTRRGCQAAHGRLKTPSWAMMVAMSSAAHSSLILPSVTR